MGILTSMYTGISGLQGIGEALSIYGDNIANANTTGFKVSRPEFQDLVASSLRNPLGGNQVGRGTKLAGVSPVYAQGALVATENATDLAITGEGFFVLNGLEGQVYSRAGNFKFNRDGKLTNSDGYRIQGFICDENGVATSKLGDIQVERTVIDAKSTKKASLYANLDMRADPKKKFDPKRPEQTSHFATGTTVFDSSGAAHTVTLFFNKVAEGKWEYRAMAKGEDLADPQPGMLVEQAKGTLEFTSEGKLKSHETVDNSFNFNKGAKLDQKIDFDFGSPVDEGGTGLQMTQYGTNAEAYKTLQDGFSAGTLSGMTFNDDGMLTGVFSNGQTVNIAKVVLAKFEAPEGLFKMGQSLFRESRASGQPTIGGPAQGGRGRIASKVLEQSTTDIANEFINLMSAQHNFQANSRVIRVADDLMGEVLNLKRS